MEEECGFTVAARRRCSGYSLREVNEKRKREGETLIKHCGEFMGEESCSRGKGSGVRACV